MISNHFFEVICCPKCKSDVIESSENELTCTGCKSKYPIVNNIFMMLDESDDKVSQIIKNFYNTAWKRDSGGQLKGKIAHEDMSNLGQNYIQMNEKRFLPLFTNQKGTFFLDAATGAQPRVEFGQKFSYHICVDFCLEGLMESKKILGDRAICVLGSLLNLPIKSSMCDGIIASHCIYHIDKDLQHKAISELLRVLGPEKLMLIFYANPKSFEQKIISLVKGLLKSNVAKRKSENHNNFYYYAHTIKSMVKIFLSTSNNLHITVKPLRMCSKTVSEILFRFKPLGYLFYNILTFAERFILSRKGLLMASYVSYIIKKNGLRSS